VLRGKRHQREVKKVYHTFYETAAATHRTVKEQVVSSVLEKEREAHGCHVKVYLIKYYEQGEHGLFRSLLLLLFYDLRENFMEQREA
jgi:hypothetical protein